MRKPRMNIYAAPGSKVVMDYPEAGWEPDRETIRRHGVLPGTIYTVERTVVHSHQTDLFLREFPDIRFNSVNFSDAETEPAPPAGAK